jgi:hypothetical protein
MISESCRWLLEIRVWTEYSDLGKSKFWPLSKWKPSKHWKQNRRWLPQVANTSLHALLRQVDPKQGQNGEYSNNMETDSVFLEQGQEFVPELSYKDKLVRNDL